MSHASIKIEVMKDLKLNSNTTVSPVTVAAAGCKTCLENAIIILMVTDDTFREMMNRCGREANKIRRGESGTPEINPSHN